MRSLSWVGLLGGLFLVVTNRVAVAQNMAPFVIPWDDASAGPMDLSWMNDGDLSPITVGEDGHFYRKGERYRLWGTSVGWLGCFLTHPESELIAARLAKFGTNAVRLHGCDEYVAYAMGNSLIDYSTGTSRVFQDGALDNFDYFVSQLQRHGIYVDVNLYVGRRFLPGDGSADEPLPVPEPVNGELFTEDDGQWHKHLGYFYDPVLLLHQEYATQLLSHVNPYTGKSYAEDPGVALVEIVNEGGLVHYWLWNYVDQYPEALQAALREKWNQWLTAKYGDTASLEVPWGVGGEEVELLQNPSLTAPLTDWQLNVSSSAVATMTTDSSDAEHPGVRLDVTTVGTDNYQAQFVQGGLTLELGRTYVISFWAKASAEREISFVLSRDGDPWNWLPTPITPRATVSTEWQEYQVTVTPTEESLGTDHARFEITDRGTVPGTLFISAPSLVNSVFSFEPGESLEEGTLPNIEHVPTRAFPAAVTRDWVDFLRATEANYYATMQDHLKNTLGVTAPILGSQIMASTPSIQAQLDVIDTHPYWDLYTNPSGFRHDVESWLITNQSAILSPPGILDQAMAYRLAGKPHVVTETNTMAANFYAGEAGVLIGGYASFHDMDGIFPFQWANNQSAYEESFYSSQLDIGYNPAQLTNFYLGALLFRGSSVTPTSQTWQVGMDANAELDTILSRGIAWRVADMSYRGFPMAAALLGRPEFVITEGATDSAFPDVTGMTHFESDTGELVWDSDLGQVTVNSARARAVVGFTDGERFALGGPGVDCTTAESCVVIEPGTTRLGFSSLVLNLVEGESFDGDARAILTAVGEVATTGMIWNADKTSLGTNWGGPPNLIEAVPATITLPRASSEVHAYALDSRGQRLAELPVSGDTNQASFEIGTGVPTIWYEVALGAIAEPEGEGNATLELCAAHCRAVEAAVPGCFTDDAACVSKCGYWIDLEAAGACDCSTARTALLTCIAENGAEALACDGAVFGADTQGACATEALAFEQCLGNRPPCGNWVMEVIEDFEDGNATFETGPFGGWAPFNDGATLVPETFATSPDGVHGSAHRYSFQLTREWDSAAQHDIGYAGLSAWAPAPADLSSYAGIGFYAKGSGRVRVQLNTQAQSDAGNDWSHGRSFTLSPDWTFYTLIFDDPLFRPEPWATIPTVFDRTDVNLLLFGPNSRNLDISIDDIALLIDPDTANGGTTGEGGAAGSAGAALAGSAGEVSQGGRDGAGGAATAGTTLGDAGMAGEGRAGSANIGGTAETGGATGQAGRTGVGGTTGQGGSLGSGGAKPIDRAGATVTEAGAENGAGAESTAGASNLVGGDGKSDGGCGCTVPAHSRGSWQLLALLGLSGLRLRRRR